MSLSHALLGILNWHPMTGYEIKKHMDKSTQFFWHAELSQIYPTLKALEEKTLITAAVIPQDGKPDRRVYSLTSSGYKVLIAWLSEPLDNIPPSKNIILLKLFFAGILPREDLLSQLRVQLEAHRARLKRIQQEIRTRLQEGIQLTGPGQESMIWELVHQYGEMQQQTTVQWLEMAIEAVEKM